jgi:hypothetical protein
MFRVGSGFKTTPLSYLKKARLSGRTIRMQGLEEGGAVTEHELVEGVCQHGLQHVRRPTRARQACHHEIMHACIPSKWQRPAPLHALLPHPWQTSVENRTAWLAQYLMPLGKLCESHRKISAGQVLEQ